MKLFLYLLIFSIVSVTPIQCMQNQDEPEKAWFYKTWYKDEEGNKKFRKFVETIVADVDTSGSFNDHTSKSAADRIDKLIRVYDRRNDFTIAAPIVNKGFCDIFSTLSPFEQLKTIHILKQETESSTFFPILGGGRAGRAIGVTEETVVITKLMGLYIFSALISLPTAFFLSLDRVLLCFPLIFFVMGGALSKWVNNEVRDVKLELIEYFLAQFKAANT